MKLYNFTPAANALRVEMFLNEKNIQLETGKWQMRSSYKSPFYTTKWDDILKVS